MLETVQRTAIKFIQNLRDISYEMCLREQEIERRSDRNV